VALQVGIVSVVYVLVSIAAQMAGQMLPVQVVDEGQVIEEELLAEVTVWMGHDLPVLFIADVSVFDVGTELLYVIESLLSDEDCTAFEADLAEGSVVRAFQMPLERSHVRKVLSGVAIMNQAIQRTKVQARLLRCRTMEIHSIILWVCLAIPFDLLVEKAPGKILIIRDYDLIQVSITHGALLCL